MNTMLLVWLLAPVIAAGCTWYALRQYHKVTLAVILAVIGALIVVATWYASTGTATSDVEILNGQITSKDRVHDTYEEPYECNCRSVQSCTGSGQTRSCTTSQVCDTCYRTHYTVEWNCSSTVGKFTIDKEDSTFRSVYATPNPQRWSVIAQGDPAAKRHSYTNYVQAVPESLFTPSSEQLRQKFLNLTPKYPDEVFDFYRINRFVTPGYSLSDADQWNAGISMMLRELGPRKQVNAIVVIAKTADPDFEYALRDAWEGANKNDVVLLIGSSQYPKIDFVRVLSWTSNELFKIELRDRVLALQNIDRHEVLSALEAQITKNFERRHMREFKYLEAEIDPPTWVMFCGVVLVVLLNLGVYLKLNGSFDQIRFRSRRFR